MEAIITQIQQTSMVEWLGTAAGLIGVYLSIKEKVLAWPFFLFCYGLYAYLSYGASLYAAMTLNACFIPISAYGWWKWGVASRGKNESTPTSKSLAITRLTLKQRMAIGGISLLATIGIGTILDRYTECILPYLDAFATSISFLAQLLLSRKLIENWIAWFIADTAFIVLWAIQGYWIAVAMFTVFTVMAALGFLSWRKELSKHANPLK
ncbi:nicotinamide riboside transporter PnuC [Candidatus Pelagisphaera phototrophica]|uniref:nicotinamide riboside transporter PnuC n=1 Tax=Candidatus Pelagisphaera phototrophica TaxID=2684113 RepID=UPI001A023FAA|nr:nicotinamide riboside transporter PnuC [Candidatus Pelagisphaera phototrophica]QXD33142.1 nicotinamide riboside transporter PnuC [Candidatus Pelagisphaera phototrophica]